MSTKAPRNCFGRCDTRTYFEKAQTVPNIIPLTCLRSPNRNRVSTPLGGGEMVVVTSGLIFRVRVGALQAPWNIESRRVFRHNQLRLLTAKGYYGGKRTAQRNILYSSGRRANIYQKKKKAGIIFLPFLPSSMICLWKTYSV